MYNLIPDTMIEVKTKLDWLLANGFNATEDSVIQDGILARADLMFEDALEGPYWTVLWAVVDEKLLVRGALGETVGYITPRSGFSKFSDDFKQNAPSTWFNISSQVEKLV